MLLESGFNVFNCFIIAKVFSSVLMLFKLDVVFYESRKTCLVDIKEDARVRRRKLVSSHC